MSRGTAITQQLNNASLAAARTCVWPSDRWESSGPTVPSVRSAAPSWRACCRRRPRSVRTGAGSPSSAACSRISPRGAGGAFRDGIALDAVGAWRHAAWRFDGDRSIHGAVPMTQSVIVARTIPALHRSGPPVAVRLRLRGGAWHGAQLHRLRRQRHRHLHLFERLHRA